MRRYKRDEQGKLVLDYCTPKGPSLFSETDSSQSSDASNDSSEKPISNEPSIGKDATGDAVQSKTKEELTEEQYQEEQRERLELIESLEKNLVTTMEMKRRKKVFSTV